MPFVWVLYGCQRVRARVSSWHPFSSHLRSRCVNLQHKVPCKLFPNCRCLMESWQPYLRWIRHIFHSGQDGCRQSSLEDAQACQQGEGRRCAKQNKQSCLVQHNCRKACKGGMLLPLSCVLPALTTPYGSFEPLIAVLNMVSNNMHWARHADHCLQQCPVLGAGPCA